ncbi:hypothetical protein C2E23DRAFT_356832 [Lenzites betulinus]|nr:hypothetical protein C2E23DRAFT_356832 [Lenzites betulinus]
MRTVLILFFLLFWPIPSPMRPTHPVEPTTLAPSHLIPAFAPPPPCPTSTPRRLTARSAYRTGWPQRTTNPTALGLFIQIPRIARERRCSSCRHGCCDTTCTTNVCSIPPTPLSPETIYFPPRILVPKPSRGSPRAPDLRPCLRSPCLVYDSAVLRMRPSVDMSCLRRLHRARARASVGGRYTRAAAVRTYIHRRCKIVLVWYFGLDVYIYGIT